MSVTTERYIVRRRFDGYQIGDEFIPTGARNDELIIEYYCDIENIELKGEGVCPGCGKEYKRLEMHLKHCKGGK
jgi:hypothetical protein